MLARHVLLAVVMVSTATSLHAEPVDPWSTGVTEDRKREASDLLDEGNALYLDRHYAEALARYRKALASWDNPGIRANIVRCLVQLERWVEAAENLDRALAYGDKPLKPDVYEEMLVIQKLLANQLGDLVIRCADPGVAVTLDGHAVATCPADRTVKVEVGGHQIVGTKQGYLTETRSVIVVASQRTPVTVAPVPLDRAGVVTRRWPLAVPLSVLAGGVAVGGVGALVRLKASGDMASYDTAVRQGCRTKGCTADMVDGALKSRALLENKIAITVISVGVAATIVGGVLLYLDRARTIYPTVETTPGGAAFAVRGAF